MEMKKEICEKCKHCLSCMCGDEFEDCFIKNSELTYTITYIIIEQNKEELNNDNPQLINK